MHINFIYRVNIIGPKVIMSWTIVSDTNKENNVNVQNITGNMPVSNFALPIEACMFELDRECKMNHSLSKVSTTSVSIW